MVRNWLVFRMSFRSAAFVPFIPQIPSVQHCQSRRCYHSPPCGAASAYSIIATFCSKEGLIIRSVFPNSARLIPGAGLSFDWCAAIPKKVIFDQ